MAIFITSVSGSKSLASFTNRTFISADHHAVGWRLMRPKGVEDLAAFSAKEVKKAAAEEKKRRVFLSRTVGVKVIPTSFLKVEGCGTLVGAKDRRERDG